MQSKRFRNIVLLALVGVAVYATTVLAQDAVGNEGRADGADVQKDVAALHQTVKALQQELAELKTSIREGVVTKRLLVTADAPARDIKDLLQPGTARANVVDTHEVAVWDREWSRIGSNLEYRTLRTNGILIDDYVKFPEAGFGPQWDRSAKHAPGQTRIGIAAEKDATAAIFMNAGRGEGEAWRLQCSEGLSDAADGRMLWKVNQTYSGAEGGLTLPDRSIVAMGKDSHIQMDERARITLQNGSVLNFNNNGSLHMHNEGRNLVQIYGHDSGSGMYLRGEVGGSEVGAFLGCHQGSAFDFHRYDRGRTTAAAPVWGHPHGQQVVGSGIVRVANPGQYRESNWWYIDHAFGGVPEGSTVLVTTNANDVGRSGYATHAHGLDGNKIRIWFLGRPQNNDTVSYLVLTP